MKGFIKSTVPFLRTHLLSLSLAVAASLWAWVAWDWKRDIQEAEALATPAILTFARELEALPLFQDPPDPGPIEPATEWLLFDPPESLSEAEAWQAHELALAHRWNGYCWWAAGLLACLFLLSVAAYFQRCREESDHDL